MRTTWIVLIGSALALVLAGQAYAGDDYAKHMKNYYKHMEEAYDELKGGDYDDYQEELAKARKDFEKAQLALRSHRAPDRGRWVASRHDRHDIRSHRGNDRGWPVSVRHDRHDVRSHRGNDRGRFGGRKFERGHDRNQNPFWFGLRFGF